MKIRENQGAAKPAAPPTALASILTVTVLEAKLKVDTSSFLQRMQVYC